MLCDVLLFRDFWFVLLSGEADSQRGKNMQSWCHLLWQQLIYSSQLQVSSNLGGPSRNLRSDTPRPTCCYFAQMPPFGRFGLWEQLGNVLKTGCLHFTILGDNDNYMPFCESLISRARRRLALQNWDTRIIYLTNVHCFAGDVIFSHV